MNGSPGTNDKKILAAAILVALGVVDAVTNIVSAAVVADGTYNLVINTTPTSAPTTSGATVYQFGKDGAWNSLFTFGSGVPGGSCCNSPVGMTDNSTSITTIGGPRGSSIGGDGWAGILGINVTGNSYTVVGVPGMGGTIDNVGTMTLNPVGRLGASSAFPGMYDKSWNVDNCTLTSTGCVSNGNTLWGTFSTVSAGNTTAVIYGAPVTAAGDLNGDGITDYRAILVSGGEVGSAWGCCYGASYFEAWNINLLSTTAPHSGFNVDTIYNTAVGDFAQYTAVPIPGAIWLFGSGIAGLMGLCRRKIAAT